MYEYRARIAKIIDGNTFIAVVDVGFYTYCHQHFRLLNYEAPEIKGMEKAIGILAKAKLEELLPIGMEIQVKTGKADSFGRWLAEVPWGSSPLSEHLIALGYGVKRGKYEERVPFDLTHPYPMNQK